MILILTFIRQTILKVPFECKIIQAKVTIKHI